MRYFRGSSDNVSCFLRNDLLTISKWAYQWKMQFNPDISKQAIEVIFSHKVNRPDHPLLIFNDIPVARKESTKHLGLILDERLSFRLHIKEALQKAKKGLGLLKYMSRHVSRDVLDTICTKCTYDLTSIMQMSYTTDKIKNQWIFLKVFNTKLLGLLPVAGRVPRVLNCTTRSGGKAFTNGGVIGD